MQANKLDPIRHGPFQSSSDSRVSYTVYQLGDVYTCNCPGYTMNKKRIANKTQYCVHLRKLGVPEPTPQPLGPTQPSFLSDPSEERFKPMLASALPEGKRMEDYMDGRYIMEPKYDGHRMLVEVTDGPMVKTIVAWSREGNLRPLPAHLNKAFQMVAAGLYDGELYVPGGSSSDVTDKQRYHELQYAVFDLVRVGPTNCYAIPANDRRHLLQQAMSLVEDACLQLAPQLEVNPQTLQQMWDNGAEGVIVKWNRAPYEPGVRSKDWIKFKKRCYCEVTIIGFQPGELGPHSRVVGRHDDGTEVAVKALNDEWRARFAKEADQWIGKRMVIDYTQRHPKTKKFQQPHADHILGW